MTIHRLVATRTCSRWGFGTQRRALATKPPVLPLAWEHRCPPPTCPCAPTPEMPSGFEIDHETGIHNLMTSYNQHVLVCTGKDDWPSRIEDDNGGDNLAADLRKLLGRGGKYHDDCHHVSVLNSSFPSSPSSREQPELQTSSVYLLPMFKYVPYVPRESSNSVEALVKGFLLAERLDPWHDKKPHTDRDRLLRKPVYQGLLRGVRDVREVVVLICGHGGRDYRCGVYGPLLRGEFEKRLPERGVQVLKGPVEVEGGAKPAAEGKTDAKEERRGLAARVGLISHVGGHKWAGNVIIYLPPDMKTKNGEIHRLAGHGIWYRRVEPRHVEGLIEETILNGLIVGELFGGGIRPDGEPVWGEDLRVDIPWLPWSRSKEFDNIRRF